jgi:MraZ protein
VESNRRLVLRGNSPAKVDAQGRLKVPTTHRRVLESYGTEFYVTSRTGQNVLIYPLSEWEKIETKLLEDTRMGPEKMRFLRNTSYYGQVATMDNQGRILIQPHLREAAEIDGEVAVMGHLNCLDVWNRAKLIELLRNEPYTHEDEEALARLGI